MTTPKYKLTMNDIERHGGAARLERDGFSRETIMKTIYKHTEGSTQQHREQIVSKLYDRERPC